MSYLIIADAGLSDNTSPTHFQTITSVTQTTTIVSKKPTSRTTIPTSYTSTRSAAVMALALRNQTPPSPGTGKNSRNCRPAAPVSSSAESTFSTQQIPARSSHGAGDIRSSTVRPNGIGDLYSGGSTSSSDNDGINNSTSSSATALRRLYFKSGRNSKTKSNAKSSMSMTKITKNPVCSTAVLYHASVEGAVPQHVKNASNGKTVPKVSLFLNTFTEHPSCTTFRFYVLLQHTRLFVDLRRL